VKQRKLLNLAALLLILPGLAALAWVFLDSFQPTATTLRKHELEVDLSTLKPGNILQIDWKERKVFVLRRTEEQIAWLKSYNPSNFSDIAKDEAYSTALNNPFRSFQEKYLVIYLWNSGKKLYIQEEPNHYFPCENLVYEPAKIQVAKSVDFPGGFYCKSRFINPFLSPGFYESGYVYDPSGRPSSKWLTPLEIPYHAFEGDKLILGRH
jgi:hypothetical protein